MEDRFSFRVIRADSPFCNKGDIIYFNLGDEIGFDKNDIIQQCTGLKDKNGRIIYEGDIVDVLPEIDEIAIVEWDNEEAKFIINHYFEKYVSTFENYYGKDLEVIGNIWEDKDLLKEGKE